MTIDPLHLLAAGDPWGAILLLVIWGVIALVSTLAKQRQKQRSRAVEMQRPVPPPGDLGIHLPQPPPLPTRSAQQQSQRQRQIKRVTPKQAQRPQPKPVQRSQPKPTMPKKAPRRPVEAPPPLPKAKVAARAGVEDQAYAMSDSSQKMANKVAAVIGAAPEKGAKLPVVPTLSATEVRAIAHPKILRRQMLMLEILRPPVALRAPDDR